MRVVVINGLVELTTNAYTGAVVGGDVGVRVKRLRGDQGKGGLWWYMGV